MVNEIDGSGERVRYVDEDFGDSPLAERFGVRNYPAVFVDDVLVARPQDFHDWGEHGAGRYTPWKEPASHRRFQDDLRRVVERRLAGEAIVAAAGGDHALETATLPRLTLRDLGGGELDTATLAGKVVLVEVWAPWCPPCLSTLAWLDEMRAKHPDLEVLALAYAAPEEDVRRTVAERRLGARVVMTDDELLRRFGAVTVVPTLFVFDRQGRTAATFYGAPADLHERVATVLERLLATSP